jgi:hypothetical protein
MRRTVSIIALLILLAGAACFLLRSHRPGSTVPPKTVPPGVRISDSSPARAPATPTAAQAKPKVDWPGSHLPPAPDQASSSAVREEPSEAVQVAVTGQDYRQRLAAIKSLGNRLPAVDVECLMKYLADTATAREGNLWDLGLKNEVLTVLLRQERVPAGMGNLLSEIVRNETIDLTWRDYALQFVPVYAARTVGRPESENVVIRSTVAAAMTSTGTCMRGTALIAMQRLGVETNLFTRQGHWGQPLR